MLEKQALATRVLDLLESQRIGVLCTCVGNDPYGSPMAYVVSPDLNWLAFATKRETRKYRRLQTNPRAVCVVDNRQLPGFDPSTAQVLVASGHVAEIVDKAERSAVLAQLCYRHSGFEPFFRAPGTAFLKLRVSSYTYVAGLDEGVELLLG